MMDARESTYLKPGGGGGGGGGSSSNNIRSRRVSNSNSGYGNGAATNRSGKGSSSPRSFYRAPSPLVLPLLAFLLPTSVGGLIILPFLVLSSLIPLVSIISLPILLSLSLFLLYSVPSILYLLYAQSSPPPSASLPFLPFHPSRCLSIWSYILRVLKEAYSAKLLKVWLDKWTKRIIILGGKDRAKVVKENIKFGSTGSTSKGREGFGRKRLDLFFPANASEKVLEGKARGTEDGEKSQVIVYLGGGNWTWWKKSWGSQTGTRLGRIGYLVVVPEVTQWPKGQVGDMVNDLKEALVWVERNIEDYGGDLNQVYLMGYGSGALVSLLTVSKDVVERYHTSSSLPSTPVSKRPRTELPAIAGLILVAGVYDVSKQLREESLFRIEEVSALRRVCGPNNSAILSNCPSRILSSAAHLPSPSSSKTTLSSLLPSKILLIAGGKDQDVQYTQAVLLNSLLRGLRVGEERIRLRLYREMTHLGSWAGLMIPGQYSVKMLEEISEMTAA